MAHIRSRKMPAVRNAFCGTGLMCRDLRFRKNVEKREMSMSLRIGSLTTKSMVATAALAGFLAFHPGARAQTSAAPTENAATPTADNAVLLTIFLKHDQSRP